MRALVVGGGIAGPAAAIALQLVGIEAVVLESHLDAREQAGSYFTVSPNGLRALEAIDCLDLVSSAGFDTRSNVLVGATGRHLGTVGLGAEVRPGLTALTMKRPRMAALLAREAARRGVEIRYGSRVTASSSAGPSATATLADGTTLEGDLVVGADGVHSLVRRMIDQAAPNGRYVGLTNFGGITRSTPTAERLAPQAWTMVFGRRAFFGAHPTPEGDVVWFVNAPRPEISRDERSTTTTQEWQRWLVELAEPDTGPFADLIASGQLELAGDNTYDLGHVPRWRSGRMLVVGDAAHAPAPSSGQGASLALEDAVVLADCLRDADSVETGFERFEGARRRRVERIVALGARSSSSKTAGSVARVFQDAMLRLVFTYVVTERSQAWVYDHRVALGTTAR